MKNYVSDIRSDKGVMFFSAGSPKDTELLSKAGIKDMLVSYFYLKKRIKYFNEELLPDLTNRKGLFMTDSGGFSFIGKDVTYEMTKEEYWLPYLEEYVQWLWDFHKYIFVAANLDLDTILGREIVDKWNEKYFKPLEKHLNIVYVAHKDNFDYYGDKHGLNRVKEYCSRFSYVGVNQRYKDQAEKVYQIATLSKTNIHGFAWTSIPLLKKYPFFSVDSTTWLGGVRYGTTYLDDGKNFRVIDFKNKHVRKTRKIVCRENNLNFEGVMSDSPEQINLLNLIGWKGARREYLRSANIKLRNKPVIYYAKNF